MNQSARSLAIANESRSIDASVARATEAAKPRTALEALAARLSVTPQALQNTLKNTAFKGCSDAEFVALVIVSNTYNLNPLLREIYAFPKKGGGIQAIVGYDGWIKIANNHPQFDGIEFIHHEDDKGNIKAVEGVLYRKDRAHPTKKMVYLSEFRRNTEPWNNSSRHMLDVRCFCHTVRLGLGITLGVEGDENLDVDGGEIRSVSLPGNQTLAEQLGDEIPKFDKADEVDRDTGEVLPRDPATGFTEVDEETARALDAGGEVEEEEPQPGEPETAESVQVPAATEPSTKTNSTEPDTSGESAPAAKEQAEAARQTVQDIDGPLDEEPAWVVQVRGLRGSIAAAKNMRAMGAIENDWVNRIRNGVPEDAVIRSVEGDIAAKKRELKAKEG